MKKEAAKKEVLFSLKRKDDWNVISINGEFTYESTGAFRKIVRESAAGSKKPSNISIDLEKCSFVDSGCLGAIAQIHKELNDVGGTVRITNPCANVLKSLRQIRLDAIIPIVNE